MARISGVACQPLFEAEVRSKVDRNTLDCGGTTPLLLRARLAPAALEFTATSALPAVEEKRGHVPAVQSRAAALIRADQKPSHKSGGPTGRMKTPNTNLQTPEKFQITSSKAVTTRAELGFGAWDLNTKHQTPNTRKIPNPKLQGSDVAGRIGIWRLGFLWCLELGVWCFHPLHAVGKHPICLLQQAAKVVVAMKNALLAAALCQCCLALSAHAVRLNITRIGEGTVLPSVGVYSYPRGQQVTITATPAAGWAVDHWEGDLTGTGSSKTLDLSGDKRVTVVFLPEVATPANALV